MPAVILTLLGTSPYSFERLARAVDELSGRHRWDVFMQIGNTPYNPLHCRFVPFLPLNQVRELVSACDLLITQGGAGSIREGFAAGKPVIAVPRRRDLGESQSYQDELVRALEQQGRIIAVYDVAELEAAVERARFFNSPAFPEHHIPDLIREFLNKF